MGTGKEIFEALDCQKAQRPRLLPISVSAVETFVGLRKYYLPMGNQLLHEFASRGFSVLCRSGDLLLAKHEQNSTNICRKNDSKIVK